MSQDKASNSITNTCNNVVINPDMHSAKHTLLGKVHQAFWRLIRNEADGRGDWFLPPIAWQVCEMREYKPIEDTSPVGDLHQRYALIAVVVISSSRRHWEEMFTHVDNWSKKVVATMVVVES